jgi:phosphatidylinositol alpha-1,6-mannosyltransferase
MKILTTIDFPPEIGGIQQYLYDQVLHYYTSKDIVINGSSKSSVTQFDQLPCKACHISWFSNFNKKLNLVPIFILLLKQLFKTKNFTIEAGNIYSAIPAYLLSFFSKKATYSVYCYGSELLQLQHRSLKSSFLKAVIRKASQRIIISNFTCSLLKKAGIDEAYILRPPKIDLPVFKRKLSPTNSSCFNILSVGRFVKHKGHLVLLDAVSNLTHSIPWKLTIAGDGPLYQPLFQASTRDYVSNRVTIVKNPTHTEIIKLYQNADLFIFPSLELSDSVEGFGIVLLEAMAYNIPVIASQTGGITDVVNNDCAILVPPGDPAALKKAILQLYYQPNLRCQLTQKAFERVKNIFSWNELHENTFS